MSKKSGLGVDWRGCHFVSITVLTGSEPSHSKDLE